MNQKNNSKVSKMHSLSRVTCLRLVPAWSTENLALTSSQTQRLTNLIKNVLIKEDNRGKNVKVVICKGFK